MYNRYAESARVNWTLNFAASDPGHKREWLELMTPKKVGLILRSIKTDYKFVSGSGWGECRAAVLTGWRNAANDMARQVSSFLLLLLFLSLLFWRRGGLTRAG
jgi:hypothetical protein